jgi:TonB-linked SusC/RagA family outer membrane protein
MKNFRQHLLKQRIARSLGIILIFNVLFITNLLAQGVRVTGIVTDNKNQPLPGVTVVVKGTATGTVTDASGGYTLTGLSSDNTLQFSFVGMKSVDEQVGSRSTINITLEEETIGIDEVVAIGYGTQKKSLITGAISSVKSDEITRISSYNPEQALQGQVAGVVVTSYSGQPGAAVSLRIRGTTTTGNAEPLYVVDGLPTGGIGFLNPSDIESIEVLKDAASAAIYGARGANGVVLVRTRQGKAGKVVLEYDGYYGWQNPAKKIDVFTAEQYYQYAKEAEKYDMRYHGSVDNSLTSMLAMEDDMYQLVGREGTDWQDLIMGSNVPIQNHNLSMRGGNEKSVFSTSISYMKQDGVIAPEKSNFEKYTGRFTGRTQFSKSVAIGSNVAFTRTNSEGFADNGSSMTPIFSALNFNPITPVYDASGNFSKSPYRVSEVYNPVGLISIENGQGTGDLFTGQIYTEITPTFLKGFTYRSSFTLTAGNSFSMGFTPPFDFGPGYSKDMSSVRNHYSKGTGWVWDNTISYERKIAEHNFTLLAGMSAEESTSRWMSGSKDGVLMDDIRFAEINSATDYESRRVSGTSGTSSLASYFGRLNYDYNNLYIFSATVRRDGSSNFGPNNKFATFPSFSAGWNVSNASFMKDAKAISTLKLRGSWGSNGNAAIGSFEYMATYATTTTFIDGNPVTAYGLTKLPNPDLKWETTYQTNLGLDLGLAQNKLMFVFDYYIKKTQDLLVYLAPPSMTGIPGSTPYNAGDVENKGFEIQANWKETKGEFGYSIGASASFNKNNVVYIGNEKSELYGGEFITGGLRTSVSKAEIGRPIGFFYGYKTDGIFNDQAEVDAYQKDGNPIQPEATLGDIKYVDINKDGVISAEDRTMIGSPHPDMVFGIDLAFTYKNFDLSALLNGFVGNDFINASWSYKGGESFGNKPVTELDGWSDENTGATAPRPTYSPLNRQKVSDIWVEDGSFMRLKNLQLGYTLPSHLMEKASISKCRIYISAQNLVTLTKYSGFDPEVGGDALNSGIDKGVYPQPRMMMLGLNLHF